MSTEREPTSVVSPGDLSWPLARAASLYGSSTALVDGERAVTYAELQERTRALVSALDALGVPRRGRVGFLGVNSLAHVECVLGVPTGGRVLVDLNFRLAEAELAFIVNDSGIEVLIVDRDQLELARRLSEQCPSLRQLVLDAAGADADDLVTYERLIDRDPAHDAQQLDPGAVAAISYTGGTTGSPKGVMLSHGNLLANARHNLLATGHSRENRWMHVCPMFHVAGTANIYACAWVGATQIILPRFHAQTVIDAVSRHGVTHTLLVPTMLDMLMDHLDKQASSPRLDTLRHVQYAASPISAELQRRVVEYFRCDIAQFYGMTEAAPTISHLTPEDHRRGVAGDERYAGRLSSIGAPIVGVQAEVRGPDELPLPPGAIGELFVRGPNVMVGYWNRPDVTAAALKGGWYRTGDAARADEDGYLYLVDRLKDMIITGGENVYSMEVENALVAHSAVTEAAVFGIPDARWGEAVHAVVTVAPNLSVTSDELIAYCRERIAGYKVPRSIEVRKEPLPRTAAGKLLKRQLREPHWARHDRRVN